MLKILDPLPGQSRVGEVFKKWSSRCVILLAEKKWTCLVQVPKVSERYWCVVSVLVLIELLYRLSRVEPTGSHRTCVRQGDRSPLSSYPLNQPVRQIFRRLRWTTTTLPDLENAC